MRARQARRIRKGIRLGRLLAAEFAFTLNPWVLRKRKCRRGDLVIRAARRSSLRSMTDLGLLGPVTHDSDSEEAER